MRAPWVRHWSPSVWPSLGLEYERRTPDLALEPLGPLTRGCSESGRARHAAARQHCPLSIDDRSPSRSGDRVSPRRARVRVPVWSEVISGRVKMKIQGIVSACCAILIACAPVAAAEKVDLGQKEFNASCAACHGFTGKGDGPFATLLKIGRAHV